MAARLRKEKDKPLATLHEEERLEYIQRERLMKDTLATFQAHQLYVEQFQDYLAERYELPSKFDIDLKTGNVYPRKEESNGKVRS